MGQIVNQIVLRRGWFERDDTYARVQGVIDFVNAMFDNYFMPEELPPEALYVYSVDYFLSQVENGGPAQFVFNSRWMDGNTKFIRAGLAELGADRLADLFEELVERVAAMGDDGLDEFLKSGLFGENPQRDALNAGDERYFDALKEEGRADMLHRYIGALPNLLLVDDERWGAVISRIARQLPDELRKERAKDQAMGGFEIIPVDLQSFHEKYANKLCDLAGETLLGIDGAERIDAGDRSFTLVNLRTDKGPRSVSAVDGEAQLWDTELDKKLVTCPAPDWEEPEGANQSDVGLGAHVYEWAARRLCEFIGERFDRITATETHHFGGKRRPVVFFVTDKGARFMLLANGLATMAEHGRNGRPIAEVPCPQAIFPGDEDFSDMEPRMLIPERKGLLGGIKRLFGG